ncbi:MAG: flagellar motor protein MotB, partial [Syntrophomonadaceae bacterium]|nr:flagellar motor protein MotB [Syntrophomonadaceae bacterium]
MARKRHKPEKEGNLERWLLTYADLITLLLIFFVVMYSISVLDAKKFQAI